MAGWVGEGLPPRGHLTPYQAGAEGRAPDSATQGGGSIGSWIALRLRSQLEKPRDFQEATAWALDTGKLRQDSRDSLLSGLLPLKHLGCSACPDCACTQPSSPYSQTPHSLSPTPGLLITPVPTHKPLTAPQSPHRDQTPVSSQPPHQTTSQSPHGTLSHPSHTASSQHPHRPPTVPSQPPHTVSTLSLHIAPSQHPHSTHTRSTHSPLTAPTPPPHSSLTAAYSPTQTPHSTLQPQ